MRNLELNSERIPRSLLRGASILQRIYYSIEAYPNRWGIKNEEKHCLQRGPAGKIEGKD